MASVASLPGAAGAATWWHCTFGERTESDFAFSSPSGLGNDAVSVVATGSCAKGRYGITGGLGSSKALMTGGASELAEQNAMHFGACDSDPPTIVTDPRELKVSFNVTIKNSTIGTTFMTLVFQGSYLELFGTLNDPFPGDVPHEALMYRKGNFVGNVFLTTRIFDRCPADGDFQAVYDMRFMV
jgi:hypothetical protein